MRLGDATWPEVDGIARLGTDDQAPAPIVLVPVGSTEQHGPHLPLATDTLIAEELAERALHHTDGLMIGPTISVSASGEHADFPGTLSIGSQVMSSVVVELVRSADWAAGVVLVNGHGGNHEAITNAVTALTAEGRNVLAWWPKWPQRRDGGPADLHAGRIETSMMLAIDPGLVRLELATAGADASLDDLRSRGRAGSQQQWRLGDPEGASGREGERFITAFVDDLVHQIERWRPLGLRRGPLTCATAPTRRGSVSDVWCWRDRHCGCSASPPAAKRSSAGRGRRRGRRVDVDRPPVGCRGDPSPATTAPASAFTLDDVTVVTPQLGGTHARRRARDRRRRLGPAPRRRLDSPGTEPRPCRGTQRRSAVGRHRVGGVRRRRRVDAGPRLVVGAAVALRRSAGRIGRAAGAEARRDRRSTSATSRHAFVPDRASATCRALRS